MAKKHTTYASDDSKYLGGGIYSWDLPPLDADNVTAELTINRSNKSKVLTCTKTINRGNYTYKLMAADKVVTHVHINNDKTNNDSVIVPVDILKELLKDSY